MKPSENEVPHNIFLKRQLSLERKKKEENIRIEKLFNKVCFNLLLISDGLVIRSA